MFARDNLFYYHIAHNKETNERFTAKIFIDSTDISRVQSFIKDIKVMQSLDSPFIIKYEGFNISGFPTDPNPTAILEYAPNGTLSDLLKAKKTSFIPAQWNLTQQFKFLYGIASGMEYAHSKDIIHCNLKPECIFLDDYLLPKIDNFQSKLLEHNVTRTGSIGSVDFLYLAPEFLYEDGPITKSADVYSFAMIMHEILTEKLPISNLKDFMLQKPPDISNNIPDNCKSLIKRCLDRNPTKRPTFKEIISFLKNEISTFFVIDEDEYHGFIYLIESNELATEVEENKPKYSFDKVQIEYPETKKLEVDFDPIDLELYEQKLFVGQGQFGEVYKVAEKKSGKIYASKINFLLIEDCKDNVLYYLSREINILSKLKHPSIIEFIGYSPIDFKKEKKPTILTEYLKNGSIEDIIKLQNRGLTPKEWTQTKILINAYGIASGMSYLHSLNILHRDIKPANIFLDEYLYPKIGDFGLSKEIKDNSPFDKNNHVGTPSFMAPEILYDFLYTKSGDVYSYSLLLYQMISLEEPFKGFNMFQLFKNIINGIRPKLNSYIPICYQKLIQKCWSNDPDKRPTFDEIVDLLENDKDFINDEIDEGEYFDYIQYIKDNQIKKSFHPVLIDFEELKKSQLNDSSLNVSNLNLNKFEKQKFIQRTENYKIYEIKNIENNEVYEAKISIISITELSRKETIHLQREINILSKLNHPSFLKFIGFSLFDFNQQPMPIIITEKPPNKSLTDLLNMIRNGEVINEWNDTKKLIAIFGVASGMAYLHSNNVIHRNLTPDSIFFDEYLFPKIGSFGLLTQIHSNKSLTFQTSIGIKGNIIYSSPELLESNEYTKSSDVYSFALLVFELLTNEVPFKNINNFNALFNEVVTKVNRPKFKDDVDANFRNLIEVCWSQNPDERPTFEDIVSILKNDPGFTRNADKEMFNQYVQFIEKSKIEFYSKNKAVKLDDFINIKASSNISSDRESTKEKEYNDKDLNNKNLEKESNEKDAKEEESDNKNFEEGEYNKKKIDENEFNAKNLDEKKKVINFDDQNNSYNFAEYQDELLNKKYLGVVDSKLMEYLFNESEPIGSSLTTSNFKVKIGPETNESDFILIKLLKKEIYSKNSEIDQPKIQEIIKLHETINAINHPNIIKSLGIFEGDKNQAPSIFYEFYSRKLKDVIKTIDDAYLVSIIYEIGHAMMIAHSNHLIHRNLCIDNIFVDSENHAKIDDFGLPILMKQSEQVSLINNDICCLSRELILNEEYNEKVDVFAFGVILLFILRRGKKPFAPRDDIESGEKIRIPNTLNKLANSIASKCLSHSQDKRPSFKAIIHTIQKKQFKLINGIDDKNKIIQNQLKAIMKIK